MKEEEVNVMERLDCELRALLEEVVAEQSSSSSSSSSSGNDDEEEDEEEERVPKVSMYTFWLMLVFAYNNK